MPDPRRTRTLRALACEPGPRGSIHRTRLCFTLAHPTPHLAGDAMVPLADVFNHKASVVALSDQYAVYEGEEGEDSSDDSDSDADEEEEQEGEDTEDAEGDEEGAASGSEAASESLGSSEASGSGGEGSGSPGASPGAGTMLTSQLVPPSFLADAEPELHGLRSANGLSLALEICIVDDEEGAALRILTASPIGEGREVHNTYGELGNRDLLEKYGFTLPENPHDSVTLELEPLWAWGAARHGAREWEARRAFLDANTPWLRRRRYAAVVVSEVEWGFRVCEWRASLAGDPAGRSAERGGVSTSSLSTHPRHPLSSLSPPPSPDRCTPMDTCRPGASRPHG